MFVGSIAGTFPKDLLAGARGIDRGLTMQNEPTSKNIDGITDLVVVAPIKDGFIDGIMVQRPVTMGRLAVEHLVAQITGEEKSPADVDTGVTVVTAENLGSYTK